MQILQGNQSVSFYRLIAIIGLVIGLPLSSMGTAWLIVKDFSSSIALVSVIPNTIATIPIVMGYVGLISLWNKQNPRKLLTRIRAVGRMALSNYLMQTLLGLTVLRLIFEQGTLDRSHIALFTGCVWTLQLAWSKPWLDKFRYGPCEWIWRKTYGS